jgi:hypothetical protein
MDLYPNKRVASAGDTDDGDWVVVSFHTVAAEELIEERPADTSGDTKKMVYLSEN